MAESNLQVKVSVDDAKWKSFVQSVAGLSAVYGGATKAAVESGQKIVASAETAAKKQVEVAKKGTQEVIGTQRLIQEASERRIRAEEQAEKMKFTQLKQEYKTNAKAIDDLNAAKKAATEKEAKEEIRIELDKAKQLQLVYRKELSERPETKKGKASDVGMLGTGREVEGVGLKGAFSLAGIGAAVEGFKMLTEKTKEVAGAQKTLQAGTGLTGEALKKAGEQAEELGAKFLVPATSAKIVMGKVAAYTGASGEALQKQTEAAMAYSVVTGRNMEMVGKLMATEQGRAKIMRDAEVNIAKAQQAANEPAQKAAYIQQQLTEKVGDLALVVLNALGPALSAIIPIIDSAGQLIQSVVKPAMDALSPVIKMIAEQFQRLAPVVVRLVEGALKLLTPIIDELGGLLGDLIPPIIDVIKTVGDALAPVFEALAPVIKTVAGIFREVLGAEIKTLLIPVLNILIPIIRDVLAPVLLSLTPLLQMVADLASAVLTPAIKLLSGILQWIVTSAIQPLIKWLGGQLATVIKETVGHITEAVGAITKVVGAVTSFLGLGSKAAEATKSAGSEVLKADQENADALQKQKIIQDGNNRIRERNELQAKLKAGKLSAQEEATLRDTAEQDNNMALLAKLDAYDKKKAAQGTKNAKTAAADKLKVQREEADKWLAEEKDRIELAGLNEKQEKHKLLEAEVEHAKKIRAIKGLSASDELKARADLYRAEKALRDADKKDAEEVAQEGLDFFHSMVAARDAEKARAASVETQITKQTLELQADSVDKQLKLLDFQQAEELKTLRENLEAKKLTSEEYDQLSKLATQKTEQAKTKITADETKKRHDAQMQEVMFFAGPFLSGFQAGLNKMFAGIHGLTKSWTESNNVLKSVFGSILDSFVGMIEQMVAKVLENAAIFALTSIFTGGGAGVLSILSGVIPGLAEGGIVNRPTVLRAGVMTQPTFLASGGLMPVIGGEAGPEAVIPLSSSRAQSQIGSALGFDKAITPLLESSMRLESRIAQQRLVMPVTNVFQNANSNYLKAEDRRSF